MFNGDLAMLNAAGTPQLYLAEALPELNTPTWQVAADGRMETTYRLKPGLTWHDGRPLAADDWVFAWRVYSTPGLGVSSTPPFSAIEEATAPDPRTLVVRWRRPYPDAGTFTGRSREFPPLPRHVLEEAFQPDQLDAFPNHPFWTREYVGMGPFRLDRWEPGAFIEAAAFDGHALGRPKIERMKMLFAPDANTALANILAGEVHLSADTSLRLEQAATLRADWGPRGAGTVLEHANQWRASNFQHRPDYVAPRANLDSRVRKALAHAVDKNAISEALYQGQGVLADYIVPPTSPWGSAIEGSILKFPYDLRASDRLMGEAGFFKGPDGFYASAVDGRYVTEAKTDSAADNVAETSMLAAGWRQVGFDVQEATLPVALAQDGESRSTFTGIFTNNTNNGEAAVVSLTLSGIPAPGNRWIGGNRGGWARRSLPGARARNT
jgi:peptide/nickel transport system substrate-binding protein